MRPAAHHRSTLAFVCLGIVLGVSGCDDGSDEGGGLEPRFSVLQEEIFTPKCTLSSCHSVTFHAGELVLEPAQAHAALTEGVVFQAAASAEGMQRVVAGDAAASFLWLKLQRDLDPKYGTTMPQASGEGLPEEDLAAIEQWIEAGAAND
jgi:hypothetical protein